MDVLNRIADLVSASAWTYLLIVAVCAVDAVLPVLPSETVVVTAGVLAARGQLDLPLVLAVAIAGAFLGDSSSYLLGRRYGLRVVGRFLRGPKGRRAYEETHRALLRRGAGLIIAARFIPGGRTATTLTAGTAGYPPKRFALAAGIGATLWGVLSVMIGYVGGSAFQDSLWKSLVLAAVIAALVTLVTELAHRLTARRTARRAVDDLPEPEPVAQRTPAGERAGC